MDTITRLKQNIAQRLVGKREVAELLITALLAEGHVLIEDVPGVGKTTLARALADSLSLRFARIQFTPDTLPGDVTGVSVYRMQDGTFETVKGPIFHQIVLADELNRTSPKTQAALLEAMEERQVTIDGVSYPVPQPFMVIATQNPADAAGTYPLPEAQLDRFLMRLSIGYPTVDETVEMTSRFLDGSLHEETEAVMDEETLRALQEEVRKVTVHEDLMRYIAEIVKETRQHEAVRFGASPRAALALSSAVRAAAFIKGRDYVTPEDVMTQARHVLPHRLVLKPEAAMNRYDGIRVMQEILGSVRVPA